jgi:hypothetical protein
MVVEMWWWRYSGGDVMVMVVVMERLKKVGAKKRHLTFEASIKKTPINNCLTVISPPLRSQ